MGDFRAKNAEMYDEAYKDMKKQDQKEIEDAVKELHDDYVPVEKEYKKLYDILPDAWNRMETRSADLLQGMSDFTESVKSTTDAFVKNSTAAEGEVKQLAR